MTRILFGGKRNQYRDIVNSNSSFGIDQPLQNGQLSFFEAGTDTPIDVYSGPDTDPSSYSLGSVVTLDALGYEPYDGIWLGVGAVDMIVYRQTNQGSGSPTYAAIWTEHNIQGAPSSAIGADVPTIIVSNIANLRTVDYTQYQFVIVEGYYIAGDQAGVRTYSWVPTSTTTDDGGSCIGSSSSPATGRWMCNMPQGDVSCTLWGALVSSGTYVDAQLQSAWVWCYNNHSTLLINQTGLKLASDLNLGGHGGTLRISDNGMFTCDVGTLRTINLTPDTLVIDGLTPIIDISKIMVLNLNPQKNLPYVCPQWFGGFPNGTDSTSAVGLASKYNAPVKFSEGSWYLTESSSPSTISIYIRQAIIDNSSTIQVGGHVNLRIDSYDGPTTQQVIFSGSGISLGELRAIHAFATANLLTPSEMTTANQWLTATWSIATGIEAGLYTQNGKMLWGDDATWTTLAAINIGITNQLNFADGPFSVSWTTYANYIGEWIDGTLPVLNNNTSTTGLCVINPNLSLFGVPNGAALNGYNGLNVWNSLASIFSEVYTTIYAGFIPTLDLKGGAYFLNSSLPIGSMDDVLLINGTISVTGSSAVLTFGVNASLASLKIFIPNTAVVNFAGPSIQDSYISCQVIVLNASARITRSSINNVELNFSGIANNLYIKGNLINNITIGSSVSASGHSAVVEDNGPCPVSQSTSFFVSYYVLSLTPSFANLGLTPFLPKWPPYVYLGTSYPCVHQIFVSQENYTSGGYGLNCNVSNPNSTSGAYAGTYQIQFSAVNYPSEGGWFNQIYLIKGTWC